MEQAQLKAAGWVEGVPIQHQGYLELVREIPRVVKAYRGLGEAARVAVLEHTLRTIEGMTNFVERTDDRGRLELHSVADLQEYCYVVAGIVGELLTELFLLNREHLTGSAEALRARAPRFGEALQLVNILKDSDSDRTEGRQYLPGRVERDEVFGLAHSDLEAAAEYVLTIQKVGGPDGLVAFTALPVLLARAALDRVETHGPGAKITRAEVFEIYQDLHRCLAEGAPVLRVRA